MAAFGIKPVARDAIGYGLRLMGLTRPDRQRYYAVTFHRVLPQSNLDEYPLAPLAVTPEEFEWFVAMFAERFTCGTLAETFQRYKAGDRPKKPLLAITFDDGQLDNYAHARPVLDRAGVKASFFVPVEAIEQNDVLWHDRLGFAAAQVKKDPALAEKLRSNGAATTGSLGGEVDDIVERAKALEPEERLRWVERIEAAVGRSTRPNWDGMMSWSQLRALVDGGHEVGSHSMSHQILSQLEGAPLAYEVAQSKRILEDRLGSRVTSFCYPNGDFNASTLAAVATAGYAQAVTTRWGPNADPHHPLTLTRVDIQSRHARSMVGQLSHSRMLWRMSRYFPAPA